MREHGRGVREISDRGLRRRAVRHALQNVLAPERRSQCGCRLEAVLVFQAGEDVTAGLTERPLDVLAMLNERVDQVGEDQAAAGLDELARFDRGFLSTRPSLGGGLGRPGLRYLAAIDADASGPSCAPLSLPLRECRHRFPSPGYGMEIAVVPLWCHGGRESL